MTNPFAVSTILPPQRGVFGEARRIRGGFLFRVIEFQSPLTTRMVYSGWWFRQKIEFDGQVVWFRISWLTILREAEFTLPSPIGSEPLPGKVEIEFGRGLMIRRFRVWISGQLAYDEIN